MEATNEEDMKGGKGICMHEDVGNNNDDDDGDGHVMRLPSCQKV